MATSKNSKSFSIRNRAGAITPVQTVIYIHGIRNQPDEDIIKRIWDETLFGYMMGERSRMAWWVDRSRYPEPSKGEDESEALHNQALAAGVRTLGAGKDDPFRSDSVDLLISQLTQDEEERKWLRELEQVLKSRPDGVQDLLKGAPSAMGIDDWAWRISSRLVTRLFLADVYDFFFDKERRERMRQIFRNRLTNAGPVVVVAHSQGSMIAYDVLRELSATECDVRLFVTCGSPLGLRPVRDRFHEWTGSKKKLPWPPCVKRWVNFARSGDIVAADPTLRDEVAVHDGRRVEDVKVARNSNPHAVRDYLREEDLRKAVYDTVGNDFRQELARRLVVASDLIGQVERGEESERFPVLIELADMRESAVLANVAITTESARSRVLQALTEASELAEATELDIDHAERFVSARLTRREIEKLRSLASTSGLYLPLHRIWRNAPKRALIANSLDTIQARSAQQAYSAHGHDIGVAVLDTGIDGGHRHFAQHGNIFAQYDCTASGKPKPLDPRINSDSNGHGTHVGAIIAGELEVLDDRSPVASGATPSRLRLPGMAPRASIHSYKVLKDDGGGEDLSIIKALDHIANVNRDAGRLMIQVVNLSLGGSFDPDVFGCGHTPMCNELRRLWQQGVVVVIAAGNEGFQWLVTAGGYAAQANLDLTIGDPANLEEAIAVGSVHRDRPHTYGVSYFSSRGPTADGRVKPDLVAPGEKILSARSGARTRKKDASLRDLYVEMSGTSMAAPHVAGAVAAFLSIRREFIGYPDRVKQLLLTNCTDLGRDRYFQGSGLLNLTRMLTGS